MRSSRRSAVCMAFLACAAASGGQAAEGFIAPGEERFKLNIGGLLYRSETEVRIDGRFIGTRFNLQDTLGIERESSAVSAELTWRLASRHRLGLRVFQIDNEAQRAIDRELRIRDRVVPIRSVLRAESRTQFFIADYRYSFVKSPRMELAGTLGVFGGRYRFRFSATNPSIDIEENVDAPLPVIGARLDWFVTPRWTASAFINGMTFDVEEIDVRVLNAGLATEYMLTRHLGLGVAYNVDSVRVDFDKGSFNGNITLTGGSLIGFVQLRF